MRKMFLILSIAGFLISMSIRNNIRSVLIRPMMAFLRKMYFFDGGEHEYTGYGLRIAMLNLPPRAIMLLLLVAVKNFNNHGFSFEGMYLCLTYGKYMVALRNLDGFSIAEYEDVVKLIKKRKEINLVLYCGSIKLGSTICDAATSSQYAKMGKELNKINYASLTDSFQHLV